MFIGRNYEIAQLNELYAEGRFHCIIMYGRRRIGKTRLLSEFCQDKKSIFYVAEEHSDTLALAKFSEMLIGGFNLPSYIKAFETWEQAFLLLAEQAKQEKIVLVLDEFPYLVNSNPRLLSVLQNIIDRLWQNTNLFVVLCGSSISFMENEVLSHKSPLFGRRTAQFKLSPMDFYEVRQFVPEWEMHDQVALYSILGGIPQYLLQFDATWPLEKNILRRLLDKSSYLFGEANWLLGQEFRSPAMYKSIIEAIAGGASRLNEIATKLNESTSKTSVYLRALLELELVRKVNPVGEKESSKKTIYRLNDPLLLFYYRFISPNLTLLEREMGEYAYHQRIKNLLPAFYGLRFEEICQTYLIRMNQKGMLPFVFDEIGAWWGNNPLKKRQEEIDIVAIGQGSVLCAECKYRNELVETSVLFRLIERSSCLPGESRYYAVFSKSGFTEHAAAFAKSHGRMILIDLPALSHCE